MQKYQLHLDFIEMNLPNSLVKNNVVCSLFPSHIILYFIKKHNCRAYKKDFNLQHARVKQEIYNTLNI